MDSAQRQLVPAPSARKLQAQVVELQSQCEQLHEHQQQVQNRLAVMQSPKEVKSGKYFSKVLVQVGAHLRKPQRKTRLSPRAEFTRVQLTWQSFDRAQYVATSGSDQELLEQCPNPDLWRAQLTQTVWCFWDHAPVWLKVTGESKVLVSEAEHTSYQTRKRLSRKTREAMSEFFSAFQSDSTEQVRELLAEACAGCFFNLKEGLFEFETPNL